VIRSIRDKNYEETKDMNRQELLEWYKTRGKVAEKHFNKSSNNPKDSG
jgi:hypothetical protein